MIIYIRIIAAIQKSGTFPRKGAAVRGHTSLWDPHCWKQGAFPLSASNWLQCTPLESTIALGKHRTPRALDFLGVVFPVVCLFIRPKLTGGYYRSPEILYISCSQPSGRVLFRVVFLFALCYVVPQFFFVLYTSVYTYLLMKLKEVDGKDKSCTV